MYFSPAGNTPLRIDFITISISSSSVNSAASSTQKYAVGKSAVLNDFLFSGLSTPKNINLLPLGVYIISIGDTLKVKYSSTPSSLIAHLIWSYTLFFKVSPTFLSTTALTGSLIIERTKISAICVDLAEPLPPLQTYLV